MKKRSEEEKLLRLIRFAERAKGLEIREKIKLVLFLKGIKKKVEVILKVGPQNLEEKFDFDKLLKEKGVVFSLSKPRSYEEIKKIKGSRVIWEIEGTYYIYDLFPSQKDKAVFKNYLDLLDKGKYDPGDRLAGRHYGYPKCCIERFIGEKNPFFLKKNYTYWEYYKKQQDLDRKFPFLFHRPCSRKCRGSLKMNQIYREGLRKNSPRLFKEYLGKSCFKGPLIVGGFSDVEIKGQSIWPKKEGYEYELIFKRWFHRHYYLVSFLSRKKYPAGQLLKGKVLLQYDYAKVKLIKEKKKIILGLHHERKLPLLGEVTLS